ncbi:hypothetical protein GCM10007860_24350 [Chitiniphilus shinanonensis]|uniref:DUF4279 domain-containing protein n=1 Tax=Chitiniphilus shinanonensis TaxID=553088 RepID=A0ABQ6BVT5_9NEIS|nr:hypothetical protein [Chitiniphilus shinanonensis]GLS05285.1 hypothetical protein GCM10007860_24350 [Chitiniphilus shinanonensis]
MNVEATGYHEVGTPRVTPKGKALEGFYKETYWFYNFGALSSDDASLEIEAANRWLRDRKGFLSSFISSGGKAQYYITVGAEQHYAFELSQGLIKECAELGVGLGLEFFFEPPLDE